MISSFGFPFYPSIEVKFTAIGCLCLPTPLMYRWVKQYTCPPTSSAPPFKQQLWSSLVVREKRSIATIARCLQYMAHIVVEPQ